jgi:hypothetical protein
VERGRRWEGGMVGKGEGEKLRNSEDQKIIK